jgi:hypothetical protein
VKRMILISPIVNALVLVPVCIGLIGDVPRVSSVYGDYSPARGILLLFKPLPILVAPLLLVQIL